MRASLAVGAGLVTVAFLTSAAIAAQSDDEPTPMVSGAYDCEFSPEAFTCTAKAAPTIPSTTVAPATTVSAATTTAAPATTSSTVPPTTSSTPSTTSTPSTPPATGVLFSQGFDGDVGLDSFRHGVFHRERDAFVPSRPEWVSTRPWPAAHNIHLADCGDPNTNHHDVSTVQGDEASFYVCRQHLMTTMGDVAGYSVVWFSPKVTGPFRKVCWQASVSIDQNNDRQWWEVMVAPVGAPDVTAISWLAGTANVPSYGDAGAVVFGLGPDDPQHPKISVGDGEPVRGFPDWGEARGNQAIRVPHCFADLGNGTLRYTTTANGQPFTLDAPGAFPAGDLKVVFKSHAYTPDKGCADTPNSCASYTWHWDDIEVSS